MPDREPIEATNLDTIYGSQTIPWSRPRELLGVGAFAGPGTSFFLGTVRLDGRPHAAGVGAAWYDGDVYFQCGPRTRKARNVANPACTICGSLPGMDLVFEGEGRRVADTATLEALAAVYREGGWPVQVDGDAFTAPLSAPSAGPPPWHLSR
jgi:hypothetical protein